MAVTGMRTGPAENDSACSGAPAALSMPHAFSLLLAFPHRPPSSAETSLLLLRPSSENSGKTMVTAAQPNTTISMGSVFRKCRAVFMHTIRNQEWRIHPIARP
jgi:hypothetical protein